MSDIDLPDFKNDHDALIALYLEVKNLRKDIQELKDNAQKTIDDHEKRIRLLEAGQNTGKGQERIIQGIVSAAVAALIAYLTNR